MQFFLSSKDRVMFVTTVNRMHKPAKSSSASDQPILQVSHTPLKDNSKNSTLVNRKNQRRKVNVGQQGIFDPPNIWSILANFGLQTARWNNPQNSENGSRPPPVVALFSSCTFPVPSCRFSCRLYFEGRVWEKPPEGHLRPPRTHPHHPTSSQAPKPHSNAAYSLPHSQTIDYMHVKFT